MTARVLSYTHDELIAGDVPHLNKKQEWRAKLDLSIPRLKTAEHHEMLEGQLLKGVTAYLDRQGVEWVRVDGSPKIVGNGSGRTEIPSSHSGMADLILLLKNGLSAYSELKAPRGGTLSTNQVRMHTKYAKAGVPHWIAQSIAGVELGIKLAMLPKLSSLWKSPVIIINDKVTIRLEDKWVDVNVSKLLEIS